MYIEEFEGKEMGFGEEGKCGGGDIIDGGIVSLDAKRVLVGAGARALFYPTLVYNVVRNKIQSEFRWWDRVGEFVLLGAVPFPSDVLRLKELGVCGVITLNEPYETLVPTSLYQANGIDHLVIPTRDYCFAPSLSNICQAVDFIHDKSSRGQTTYVHCKAGRGRSTTIVLCYLVQHKQMTPDVAYDYVKSIRPRVRLAFAQWQAVQEYYHLKVRMTYGHSQMTKILMTIPRPFGAHKLVPFDDNSVVVVSESDLDGYNPCLVSNAVEKALWTDLSVVYRVRVASKAAIARISWVWLGTHSNISKLGRENSCSIRADQLGGSISVDIHVY